MCPLALPEGAAPLVFLSDRWPGSEPKLHLCLPKLHPFFINNQISEPQALAHSDILDLYHLPLSPQAFDKLQLLSSILQDAHLNSNAGAAWF